MAADRYDYGGGTADDRTSAYDFDQMAGQHGFFGLASYRDARTMRELRDQIKMMESGLMTPEQAFPEGGPWAEKYERAFGTPFPGMQTITPSEMDPTTGEMIPGPEQQVYGPLGNAPMTRASILADLRRGTQPGPSEELMAASGMIKGPTKDILAPNTRNARLAMIREQEANKQYRPLVTSIMDKYPQAKADAAQREAQHILAGQFPSVAATIRRYNVERPTAEELGPSKPDLKHAHKMEEQAATDLAKDQRQDKRYALIDAIKEKDRALLSDWHKTQDENKKDEIQNQRDGLAIKLMTAQSDVFIRNYASLSKNFDSGMAFDMAKSIQEHGGRLTGVDIPPWARKEARDAHLRVDAKHEADLANTLSVIKKRDSDLVHGQQVDLAKLELNWIKIQQAATLGHKESKERLDYIKALQTELDIERKPGGSPQRQEEIAAKLYPLMGFETSKGAGLLHRMFGIGSGGQTTIKSGGTSYTPQAPAGSLTGGGVQLQPPPALEALRRRAGQNIDALNTALPPGTPPIPQPTAPKAIPPSRTRPLPMPGSLFEKQLRDQGIIK